MLDIFLGWFVIAIPFLLAVGGTVLALRIPDQRHYWKFVWWAVGVGLLFSGLTWWQQYRASIQAVSDRQNAITETAKRTAKETSDNITEKIKTQYQDMVASLSKQNADLKSQIANQGKKVDVIGGSPFVTGTKPVKVEVTNPNAPASQSSAVTNGVLTISQTDKISTRSDAPYEIEVVIQSTVEFPELKLTFQCDKKLVNVEPMTVGVFMMQQFGILQGHPNVYFEGYASATPPFGPANPLIFEVWTKEPAICAQVQSY
jgi:hypothetical protein